MEHLERIRQYLRTNIGNSGGLAVHDPNSLTVATHSYDSRAAAGTFFDCSSLNSYVLDEFLYTDAECAELLPELENYFCARCKLTTSKRRCKQCKQHTSPRSQISCSLSVADLSVIREELEKRRPDNNLRGATIVDVGSRMGNVLYYFALTTEVQAAVGVEIDRYFVELTSRVISKFRDTWEDYAVDVDGNPLPPRVRVIGGNVLQQADLLESADIVIMFNPFEHLFSTSEAQTLWRFVHQCCQGQGKIIVTVPPLREVFRKIGLDDKVEGVDMEKWIRTDVIENGGTLIGVQTVL